MDSLDPGRGLRGGEPSRKYDLLVGRVRDLPPVPTAVAHPCTPSALLGATDAAEMNLIAPILVGPRARIEALAAEARIDLSRYEIVDAPHSHASAEAAVALVRAGRAEILMKGSLHTDELLAAVVQRDAGLRTARRISHCFIMDVPGHPNVLTITDAAINIAPTLEEKADIVQNAIDLAHSMGLHEPRVAILSATETINPKLPSTIEAAALCKMASAARSPAACSTARSRSTTRSAPRLRP